jgi:hypothetical protein
VRYTISKKTVSEHIVEITYKPDKCHKNYQMIILRKTIKVTKGELKLLYDIWYFFYITNEMKKSAKVLIEFYRNRADHENDIEQLKNGARALQTTSDTLISNWAYMVHCLIGLVWHAATLPTCWTPDHAYGIQTIYQYLYPNPVPDYKNRSTDLLQSCRI